MPETIDNQLSRLNTSIPLSIAESAKLFGLSEKTIRRAIKKKELHYYKVMGRYRMQFQDVLNWTQKRTRLSNAAQTKGIGQYVDKWKQPTLGL